MVEVTKVSRELDPIYEGLSIPRNGPVRRQGHLDTFTLIEVAELFEADAQDPGTRVSGLSASRMEAARWLRMKNKERKG